MKTRAWDNVNKSWIESFYVNQDGEVLLFTDTDIDSLSVIDAILCPCIEMKDKKGVDLYRYDIIKADGFSPENYVIDFIDGAFCAINNNYKIWPLDMNHFYPSIGCQIEKIGNKFEHGELLK